MLELKSRPGADDDVQDQDYKFIKNISFVKASKWVVWRNHWEF